jgi:hypothetical protein
MSALALRRTVFLDGERPPDDYIVVQSRPHLPHAKHRPGVVAVDADRMGGDARNAGEA